MGKKRDGSSNWDLADALLAEVGQFDDRRRFNAVRRSAESAGVEPLSVSALRQYRDVAHHWPPSDRIPGVSFSAHRASIPAPDPKGLLTDLADVHGPNRVTVKKVNASVAVVNNRVPVKTAGASFDLKTADARDIVNEWGRRGADRVARQLIDTKGNGPKGNDPKGQFARDLLTDIVARIDRANAKGRRKSAQWGNVPAATEPGHTNDPTEETTTTDPTRRAGDVRGL